MSYKIGQKFEGIYPPEAAIWCNANGAHIEKKKKCYYIVENAAPTEKEVAQERINELKGLLAASDYKAIKYAEGLLTAEEYAETKAQRAAWRAEINELEAKLEVA